MLKRILLFLMRGSIDRIISLTGGINHVTLWNGVNFSREFMFKNQDDKFDTPENLPYLKIGFGQYISGRGDWGGGFEYSCWPIVSVFIDKDLVIRDVEIESEDGRGSASVPRRKANAAKKIANLLVGHKFFSKNERLNYAINWFFNRSVAERYSHYWNIKMRMFSLVIDRDRYLDTSLWTKC